MNKDTAYNNISQLVERFNEQLPSYKNANYNETLTRRDFIDPFFKSLGWDVDNSNGYAEAYREVIHEDKIKIGGATKAPDYSFRLSGGKKLFFVEAKKPSVAVKDDIIPAYQIRRYGWSAKLPISIITDFEEFSVYDCTKKPNPADKASTARIKYLTFDKYQSEFDFLWDTFSKEKVLKGSFDKYIASDKNKKGTATVDKEFLQSLDNWRTLIAIDICKKNKELNEDEINFAVQQTIDRLIFLRIAEDRSVEPYGQLKYSIANGNYYENLYKLFQDADDKYNSGLFDLKKDQISKSLVVDNKIIKTIINDLYYPQSPYEFSVLSVEILGSAYEQFLGKQIKIDAFHKATIELKPEVRKAGGVYYTPEYIVEYIVKNTVGKLVENKSPKEVSKIKIVDPACGSGSFLIGAYQYLLTWYKDYYNNNIKSLPKKNNPLTPEGNLTTAEKKKILLDNIYGVDIDINAVEVTKLSLLLKCLEGETSASISHQLSFFKERILPTLENNIKSGNSLIDTDFYSFEFEFGEEKKIKPFNWQKAFPNVFKDAGFDVVIGNPPWGADLDEYSLKYLRQSNQDIIVRMIDSFMYFVHKGYVLAKPSGRFGMILPDVLFYQTDNSKLREFILKNSSISNLLNLGNVFEGVTRPSCIIIFSKLKAQKNNLITTTELVTYKKEQKHIELYNEKNIETILQKEIEGLPAYLFVTRAADNYAILNKINKGNVKKLKEYVDDDGIQRGVSPDLKEAFLVTAEQIQKFQLETSHLKPVITGGKHVKRYFIKYPDLKLIYTNRNTDFKQIPNICKFINQFRNKITCKEVKTAKHSLYSLHRAREEKIFTKNQKLVGVITEDEIIVSIDDKKTFVTDGLYIFWIKNIDEKFLMGLLNSKLFVFLYRLTTMEGNRALAQVKPTIIAEMPIRFLDDDNINEMTIKREIIKNVDSLLKLYPEIQQCKLESKKEQLTSQAEFHSATIDSLVYKLYELTIEEIKKVENTLSKMIE